MNLQCSALTEMGVVVVNRSNSVTWVKYVTVALKLTMKSRKATYGVQIMFCGIFIYSCCAKIIHLTLTASN